MSQLFDGAKNVWRYSLNFIRSFGISESRIEKERAQYVYVENAGISEEASGCAKFVLFFAFLPSPVIVAVQRQGEVQVVHCIFVTAITPKNVENEAFVFSFS